MTTLFIVMLVLAALATLAVLALGLKGLLLGNTTPQHQQGLMQKRILFQAIAIVFAILLLLVAGSGGGR